MATVYVSIGNSDDKLTQAAWATFVLRTHQWVESQATTVHGSWVSPSASRWQNAIWCAVIHDSRIDATKDKLRALAHEFGQESIAWAEAPVTEFLS